MDAPPKPPVLGNSMIVPSVQELASKSLATVPPRYIQMLDHQDPPFIINEVSTVTSALPIIDLQTLLSHTESNNNNFDSELVKLHSACEKWGFFQLVNHGVNTSLLDKVKSEIESFFKLPMEEKKKYWQDEENFEGFGQAFVFSEEQKLDWADLFYMITLPRQARKHHLFPKLPRPLRDALESYTSEMQNLAMKLKEFIGRALEIETKVMNEFFKDGLQTMRMNYYPPCPQPELVMGLAPHSDAVGISILFQLNEVEGLQIKNEGIWIPVKPLPNTFIVNLGDILEILTNGLYRSVEHRVTVNSMKERLSVATFYSPKLEEVIGPLPCLINPHNPALFKTVGVEEYFKKRYSLKPNGKLTIDFMRIEGDTA